MYWFLVSLIGPFLWAISNHLDKILVTKFFKKHSIGALLIYSSLIGVISIPIVLIFSFDVWNLPISHVLILILLGVMSALMMWLYFLALEKEEVSIVVPFFQLVPVFAFVLGYFILGEELSALQIMGMILIVFGASILSIEIDQENKFKLKFKTAILMTLASLLSAIESVFFKYILIRESFWLSTFWLYIGLLIFGIVLFIFFKRYRDDFILSLKNYSKKVLSLNIANELITTGGNLIFTFTYLFLPVAVALLASSYQPFFVYLIAIFLTIFFPKIAVEKMKVRRHHIQKILVLIIMGIGTWLLFV